MSSIQREILRRIDACLTTAHLGPDTPLLAACSGGPDSTALVLLLDRLKDKHGYPLSVAHYNHNLRGAEEAAAELETVQLLCDKLHLDLLTDRALEGQIERVARNRSLEAVAREFRHHFLTTVAVAEGFRYVALGHTLDDQTETLTMRFFQGSGWRGLSGMHQVDDPLLRPLLSVSHGEVMEFLTAQSASFYIDQSNGDPRFLRNRIRRAVIPTLVDVFPGQRRSLQVLSDKMRDLANLVDTHRDQYAWDPFDRGYRIPVDRFRALPRALRFEGIAEAWDGMIRQMGARLERRLSYRFLEPLLDGSRLELSGYGVRFRVVLGNLTMERVIVSNVKKGYVVFLGEPRDCAMVTNALRIAMERLPKAPRIEAIGVTGSGAPDPIGQRQDAGALVFAKSAVHPPLIVRSRYAGDRLRTMSGTRSVKKILIDTDVRVEMRHKIPLLVDKLGVVAVLGAQYGGANLSRRGLGGTAGETQFLLNVDQRS